MRGLPGFGLVSFHPNIMDNYGFGIIGMGGLLVGLGGTLTWIQCCCGLVSHVDCHDLDPMLLLLILQWIVI